MQEVRPGLLACALAVRVCLRAAWRQRAGHTMADARPCGCAVAGQAALPGAEGAVHACILRPGRPIRRAAHGHGGGWRVNLQPLDECRSRDRTVYFHYRIRRYPAPVATFALIHGGGGSAWDWHFVAPELREREHDVVTVDLPSDDETA